MFVHLLIVILVDTPMLGKTDINVVTYTFKESSKCERAAESIRKELTPKYKEVSASCQKKEVK